MKILVVGSGGREHAMAWRLAYSPRVQKVYVAPGNGGTASENGVENVAISEIPKLIDFCRKETIALTVVGPEAPLAAGIVDEFQAAGLRIFGPTRAAARLESSKDFAKSFMVRHGLPTARHATFTAAAEAKAYIDREGAPIVVKADGLAAGKGVVVATTREEAHAAVEAMLGARSLGEAGGRVVIEQFLQGEEASFIVMCDGAHVLPLATSQDHKRLRDGDQGPNTGGMGAYSPAPVVTPKIHARVMREIILPAVQGMAKDGTPYVGFLYAGLMIDGAGNPRTLEFNCRLGDPETQVVLPLLTGGLTESLERIAAGKSPSPLETAPGRFAVTTVLAAAGYPDAPEKGAAITIPATLPQGVTVFHAGTKRDPDGTLRVNGGRVMTVTAVAPTFAEARTNSRAAAESIEFDGKQYRRDIGWREATRR
jgi:phosphoribosylamine--glycine ligase